MTPRRWWILAPLLLLAIVLGYAAAGPWLAIHGIREAIRERDAAALAGHVDFPALRASLKAQLSDRLVRATGLDAASGPLAAMGLSLAGSVTGGAVDAMVTPAGIGALMEGQRTWDRIGAEPPLDEDGRPQRADPLRGARHRYESASRFTATVRDGRGRPVVFVFTRHGLRWKLSGIVLPPD